MPTCSNTCSSAASRRRSQLALDCGIEGEYTGANVIGEITGRGKPDEYFVMGGHLDSWDPGTGAIDDGAGIAIAVGAAHLIAQLPQRPQRSIRVVAFANEEAGLFGGKAYAAAHAKDIAKAVLGSESDLRRRPHLENHREREAVRARRDRRRSPKR